MGFLSGGFKTLLGGALSLGGSLIGASSAKSAASDANAFTEEQLKNRHQWEVSDLKTAGLNPILSANGTPSIGGSAMASVPDFSGALNKGVSTALEYSMNKKQIEKLDAEIENTRQDTEVKRQTEVLVNDQSQKTIWETLLTQMNAEGVKFDNVLRALDASIYGDTTGKAVRYGEKGANILKDLGIGVGAGMSGMKNSAKSYTTNNNTTLKLPDGRDFKLPLKGKK